MAWNLILESKRVCSLPKKKSMHLDDMMVFLASLLEWVSLEIFQIGQSICFSYALNLEMAVLISACLMLQQQNQDFLL